MGGGGEESRGEVKVKGSADDPGGGGVGLMEAWERRGRLRELSLLWFRVGDADEERGRWTMLDDEDLRRYRSRSWKE